MREQGISIGYFSLHNRTGVASAAGIGVRIPNTLWIAGQWVDAAGTPFTDDTTDAQDTTGAGDFALETLVVSDGYVVASRVPFNAIGLDVDTASVGAAGVRNMRFTDAEGDAWTDMTEADFFSDDGFGVAGTQYATGEQLAVWAVPPAWGRTQNGGLSGIPEGYYAINVRATVAYTTAGLAGSLNLYRIYWATDALADNGTLEWSGGGVDFHMPYGDGLVAYFDGAISTTNSRLTASVRTRS